MTSTLALKKADFEAETAKFLGWGRGALFGEIAWTPKKLLDIQMDVASALRRFYYCGHPWSFLQPTADLTLPSGASSLRLPDDFCGVNGGVKVNIAQASDGLSRFGCEFEGAGRVIQAQILLPDATGFPRLLAIRPIKEPEAGKMQRSELICHPTADQAYTLSFPYVISRDYLVDVTTPYAAGGLEHHETILQLCRAVAEQVRDNVTQGPQEMKAAELLQKSIHMDRLKQPTRLGYNGDRSDGVVDRWNGHGWTMSQGVNIDGVVYT